MDHSAPVASSSTTRILSGTLPGLLDPTQPPRVLRHPNSALAFAYHDPQSSTQDSLNELCKNRRVVIEYNGGSVTWRFVPRAILEDGVQDEGHWPRVVNICGQLFECSQDQWDIYKLDNKYECRVRLPPALSTITLAATRNGTRAEGSHANGINEKRHKTSIILEKKPPRLVPRKKYMGTNLNSPQPQHESFPGSPMMLDSMTFPSDDEGSEDEVDRMVVDQEPQLPRARSRAREQAKQKREEKKMLNKKTRRTNIANRNAKLDKPEAPDTGPSDGPAPSSSSQQQPSPQPAPVPKQEEPEHTFQSSGPSSALDALDGTTPPPESPDAMTKRKVNTLFNPYTDMHYQKAPEAADRNMFFYEHTNIANTKRARTVSPTTAQRELGAKRYRRKKARETKRRREQERRREKWNDEFMAQVFAEVPDLWETPSNEEPSEPDTNVNDNGVDTGSPDDSDNEDEIEEQDEEQNEGQNDVDSEAAERAFREAAIAESRRKLAELEKDRHLWEAEERKRKLNEMREMAEQENERLCRQQKRWAESREAEIARQKLADEEEARKRAQTDGQVRQQRVQQQREKYKLKWPQPLSWTRQRAVEYYQRRSEEFDTEQFSDEQPFVWEAVPWPVLESPRRLPIGNIAPENVKRFLEEARLTLNSRAKFRAFLSKSRQRFHPDRWMGRRYLRTVMDDNEKRVLEAVALETCKVIGEVIDDMPK